MLPKAMTGNNFLKIKLFEFLTECLENENVTKCLAYSFMKNGPFGDKNIPKN